MDQSNGSPILVGDKLFFLEEPDILVCVDSQTGEVLWKRSNALLSLLGLSEQEIKSANATLEESRRIDAEMNRLIYERDRILGGRGNLSPAERDRRAQRLLAEWNDLGNKKAELSKNDKYGDYIMPATHPTNGYTSYTPVSDGKVVYTCFGSGAVVAFDLEGNRLWHTVLDDPDEAIGGSSSPILVDGTLIVRFSDYVALDPMDGSELWRTPSRMIYGTAVPFNIEGKAFIFTPKGDVIRVPDGKKFEKTDVLGIDEATNLAGSMSPIISGDRLYTCENSPGHVYRFRIPTTLSEFEESGFEMVWRKQPRNIGYYSSPIEVGEHLYLLTKNSRLVVLKIATGEFGYNHRIEGMQGTAYSSLVLAGNLIFAACESGQTVLFEPGPQYKEVGRSKMAPFRSTPIFVGGSVYLRTQEDIRMIR